MPPTMPTIEPGHLAPYGALPVPRLTPELLQLVRTGAVYSLEVIWHESTPSPGDMVRYSISPRPRHGDLTAISPASAAGDAIAAPVHTGTHIDALCHIGEHQDAAGQPMPGGEVRLYAGPGRTVAARDTVTYYGQAHLSIAEMPPIVARGVLLDVAGYKGVDVLPDAYEITADDVAGTAQRQGVSITPGTAVLVRTGFYVHLTTGNRAYLDRIAGIGLGAAQCLAAQGMILVGADNMTVEAIPPLDHRVHRFLLVHHGITHLESLYLEELAAAQVYEFLLIVTPLRIAGATGSWVHPIAIC